MIHLEGAYKFDIFPVLDAFARAQLDGRRFMKGLLPGLEDIDVPVLSAEDTILAKLRWCRAGGEVSDRQWNDVLGVIQIQRDRLGIDYIREWGARLGLSDLIARAWAEMRRPGSL